MLKRKLACALGFVAAMAAAPAGAVGTGVLFKVQEGAVPGTLGPNLITADSADYSYEAHISQSLVGAALDFDDPFLETGTLQVSSFKNGIITQPGFLNGLPAFGGYGLVGDFTATGVAGVVGIGIKAIFSSFTMNLWIDVDQNGTGDLLLGTAVQTGYSEANIFGGLANGDFDIQMHFTPTAFGNTYFVSPAPFDLHMETTGNTTTITGAALGAFEADVDGSGNLFVPEPGSLALAGLALAGLGLIRRKRSS